MNVFNEMLGGTELELPILIASTIISLLVSVALFIIKGIAIYTMAKRRNFDKLWMAYVPFLNYILLGKLAGKAVVWGKEIKNIGLVVCILSAVTLIGGYVLDFGYYLAMFGLRVETTSQFVINWISQTGVFYLICYIVYLVLDLVNLFLTICLALLIFRKYYPERAFLYMILSIFFDFMFGILLFTVRNKDYLTYEDFLRTRQNQYNAQNPYGRYNGYTNYNTPSSRREEDPFPEFSNNKQDSEPFAEFNGGGDKNVGQSEITNSSNNESKNNSNEDDLFN